MNINAVRSRLEEKNFHYYELSENIFNKLSANNLEVWSNDNRVMVLKEYTSYHHLLNWKEDQLQISFLYDELTRKYKNNLYFLLVLNWSIENFSELVIETTIIEKDQRLSRKYTIYDETDIERVPFLQTNNLKESISFAYESEFRKKIIIDTQDDSINQYLSKVINYYFKNSNSLEIVDGNEEEISEKIKENIEVSINSLDQGVQNED